VSRPFSTPPAIGSVFTYLAVIGERFIVNKNNINYSFIPVICKCGKKITVKMTSLQNGRKKSCGCLLKEISSARWKTQNGLSKTKEYRAWRGMINRCYDPGYSLFHRYGGRGIVVCERWLLSFDNFLFDMGQCPVDKNSLDRYPNNDGNYEPANCRWATDSEQANNRSTCQYFTINGISKTLNEWCLMYNISYKLVHNRIFKSKWDIIKALTAPIIDSKFKSKQ